MTTLLTVAGRKHPDGVGSDFEGGVVVQLDSGGTWSELASDSGDTIFWRLKNFINGSVHMLFHIRSTDFQLLNTPLNGKLFRSIDQGASWTDVTPDDSGNGEFARDMAQDVNGDLWLTTDERENGSSSETGKASRIYKSTDDGVTWAVKHTTVSAGLNRFFNIYNITCHPTDANIIVAEGRSPINATARMWRATDGSSFTRFTPTLDDADPTQAVNTGGAKMHVMNFLANGDMVWAGIFETANDDFFILQSTNDGDNWSTYLQEADSLGFSTDFQEDVLVYITSTNWLWEAPADLGSAPTKIADVANSPFSTGYDVHTISKHSDTLHLGIDTNPGTGATDDPSIYTRPVDLSSDWVQHTNFDNMDSDLGYRVYPAIDGLVGATEDEADEEPVRPPKFDEPPGGGGPIGDPGIGDPGIGEARRPRVPSLRGKRGRRGFKAGPPGFRSKLPPAQGEQIDKTIPDEYKEPLVRKWLKFGWLVRPMLEGQKTMTLRDWGPIEGVQWQHGELFFAYDIPPVEGGRRLALLRVMQEPFEDFTAGLRMADYHKLGFAYAMANQLTAPSGRTALEIWEDLIGHPRRLWLLRFQVQRIFEQGRKEQDTVNVGVPRRI